MKLDKAIGRALYKIDVNKEMINDDEIQDEYKEQLRADTEMLETLLEALND